MHIGYNTQKQDQSRLNEESGTNKVAIYTIAVTFIFLILMPWL